MQLLNYPLPMEASAAESVGVLLFLVVLALTLVAILATLATVWFRGVHVHVHLHNHNNMIATGDGSNIATSDDITEVLTATRTLQNDLARSLTDMQDFLHQKL